MKSVFDTIKYIYNKGKYIYLNDMMYQFLFIFQCDILIKFNVKV